MPRSRSTAVERTWPTMTETDRFPVLLEDERRPGGGAQRGRPDRLGRAGPRARARARGPRPRARAARPRSRAGRSPRGRSPAAPRGRARARCGPRGRSGGGVGVVVDRVQRAAARRREPRGLAADVERSSSSRARSSIARPRASAAWTARDRGSERRGDVVEHGRELGEHGRRGLPDHPARVGREDERADDQRDAAADQRVERAGELDARSGGRSVPTSAAETAACWANIWPEPSSSATAIESATTSAELPPARAEPDHEQVRDRDPERHAEDDLERAAAALRPVRPSVIIAETGREERRGWPTTPWRSPRRSSRRSSTCRIERAAWRNRSARVRADRRERSAASSSRGCARSESVRGGSATPSMLAAPRAPARGDLLSTTLAPLVSYARDLRLKSNVRAADRRQDGVRTGVARLKSPPGVADTQGEPDPPCRPGTGPLPPSSCARSRPASSPSAWSAPASTPPPWAPARSRRTKRRPRAPTAAAVETARRRRPPSRPPRPRHPVPVAGRDRRRGHARGHPAAAPRHADADDPRPPRPPRRRPCSPAQTATPQQPADHAGAPNLGVDKGAPRAERPSRTAPRARPASAPPASSASAMPQPQPLLETVSSPPAATTPTSTAPSATTPPPRPSARTGSHPVQPGLLARDPRAGPDRRPELLHREVPHPAVPAPDLPGRRHPVRHPLGGPGRDQRDRDRLRPQPEHLLRRRARLDAVHAPTWDMYGVDANGDGQKDPFNPVDAIFAAARYLRAAGADEDLYRAIFAYNHADWYVESVLMRARVIGGLPADLVGSLTGLTQGRFPVAAKATYAGALSDEERAKRFEPGRTPRRSSSPTPPAARSTSSAAGRAGGRRPRRPDHPHGPLRKLGRFVELQDTYGNTYLYAGLRGRRDLPGPRAAQGPQARARPARGRRRPKRAASRTKQADVTPRREGPLEDRQGREAGRAGQGAPAASAPRCPRRCRPRSGCSPTRPARTPSRPAAATSSRPGVEDRGLTIDGRRLDPKDYVAKPLKKGARVIAGTVLGRIGRTSSDARPARALRDPPGRPRRPADRPEADPRRLEAARVDRDLPLQEAQPVLRRRRRGALDRPDHADEQGGAPAPRAPQPEHRHLRVRPPRHRHGPDRPPRARHARVPRRLRPEADGHLAAAAATAPTRHRATCPSTPPAPRSTSARSTGSSSTPPPRARARSPTSRSSAC